MSKDLENVPLDFELENTPAPLMHRSFWFSHPVRALELADQPEIRSFNELMALGEEERDEYIAALYLSGVGLVWPRVVQSSSDSLQ
jgi:hypothetical protein